MKLATVLQSFTAYPGGKRQRFLKDQELEIDTKLATRWSALGLVKIGTTTKLAKPSQKTIEPSSE